MKLATILVAASCLYAGRAHAVGIGLRIPSYGIAVAAPGDEPGLAAALDAAHFGNRSGRDVGIVVTGDKLRANGPLVTLNGDALAGEPARGTTGDAAWVALAALERAPVKVRALALVGPVDAREDARLHAAAGAAGVTIHEYANASEFEAVYSPRLEPPPPALAVTLVRMQEPVCTRDVPEAPPLPAWPAFALLGVAAALSLRASRARAL